MYLALEPYLRRRRPEWLISWSRLLAGGWRDPLVGRDVLVGVSLGVCMMLGFYLDELAPTLLGQPRNVPNISSGLLYSHGLLGLNGFVPLLVNQTVAAIQFTFIAAFLLLTLIPPTVAVVAVARFGLLTLIVTFFCVHLTAFFPATTELSAWYAGGFVPDLVLTVALALYGFRTSLAGQPLVGGRLLDD